MDCTFQMPKTLRQDTMQASQPYLENLGTDPGVDFKGFRVEAAPTALALSQIPGTSCHPQSSSWDPILRILLKRSNSGSNS